MSLSFSTLLDILVERHVLPEEQKDRLKREESKIRKKLFRQTREQYAGKLANPGSIHPMDVLLSLDLFKDERLSLDEEKVARFVAEKANVPFKTIDPLKVNMEVLTRYISRPFARKNNVVPIAEENDTLICALVDPFDRVLLDSLRRNTGKDIQPVVATKTDITRILTEFYGLRASVRKAESVLDPLVNLGNLEQLVKMKTERELEASDSHVVKAVEYLLHYAYDQRASDIHIEPKRDESLIRFRIDGVLHDIQSMSPRVHAAVISRLKLLSRMDIAERRKPQDGRIKTELKEREVELRCSILPVAFGEKLVIRIFDPEVLLSNLSGLGFPAETEKRFEKMIHEPNGMILVSGPTGSGKTTTLYSALKSIASRELNITTIEDPVEMVYEPFNQVTVNPLLDLSFAGALRTILRQDPDVIMVGEIRDKETAAYAIQAAMTGHLLLSTIHTNDAPSSVARLFDLEAEPFLVSSTLIGVLAQRLVRKVCDKCETVDHLTHAQLQMLSIRTKSGRPLKAKKGKGCHHCRYTGLKGRTGIFELMDVDETVRSHIAAESDIVSMKKLLKQKGMMTLKEASIKKLIEGETSFNEIIRVCMD
ncbi:MAG: type II secretion system protein E [Acidobacteria bacterium]|nr:MAG: type II secretion system protein E [Acidobacteriota bacterium]